MGNEESVPGISGSPNDDLRELFGHDGLNGDNAAAELEPAGPLFMRIGDYEVIEELGRGGMGVVYKARQSSLNRVVEIKMILGSHFVSNQDRLRFFQEAELIASLRHPNIVSIHEIGIHEGQPFYAMDFIEGTSLKELVQVDPLPWKEAARLAQIIAQAIHTAHERGVIHRDLKPANILVDASRNPHVADFGLARDLHTDHHLTMTGASLGTPEYMSPEQSSGSRIVLPSTDVYSIGAILYEMLTTLPPFLSINISELFEKVRTKDPIAPKLINPSVPRDLNTVCLKCLQKDHLRRYQSASELAEELDRVLNDVPIKAKPISPIERGWRWCKRHRALASVIVGSSIVIVAGTITAFIVLNRERIRAEYAQHTAEQALAQLQEANAAIVGKNKELQSDLDEITHQKGVIATVAKTDAERDMEQAVGLFHDLRLPEAQAAADKIVAAQPNLPGGWYLDGQLALVSGNLSAAKDDLQKAADLSPNGLDEAGQSLLALVNQYAQTAQQTPGGKLTARDSLALMRDLRGREEYFAFVAAQQKARDVLLQSIRLALAVDNGSKFADAAHVAISEEGEEVVLTLKDIPSDPDLSGIKAFPIFTALHLENTGITSLAPFEGMQLSRIEVVNSPVTDLDALKDMPLQNLSLLQTGVKDLSSLRNAPLHSLVLDQTPVPPEELLEHWPLDNLRISDEPLPNNFAVPKQLRSLGLARTGLTDLQLVAASALESLDVSGNPALSSLDPLHGMNTLHRLDLSDTAVSSLQPLAGLNLQSLSLRNTPVGEIATLKDMPLQELDLRGCKILDLEQLAKLPPKYFPPTPK